MLIPGAVYDVSCHLMKHLHYKYVKLCVSCPMQEGLSAAMEARSVHDAEPTDHKTKHIKKEL